MLLIFKNLLYQYQYQYHTRYMWIHVKTVLKFASFFFFVIFLNYKTRKVRSNSTHILLLLQFIFWYSCTSCLRSTQNPSVSLLLLAPPKINHAATFPLPIFSLSFGTSETFEIHFFISSSSRRRRKQHLHFKGLFSSGQPSRDTLWNNSARSLPQSWLHVQHSIRATKRSSGSRRNGARKGCYDGTTVRGSRLRGRGYAQDT